MALLLPLPWVSHVVWNIIFLGFFFAATPPATLLPNRCGKGQWVHPPHFTLSVPTTAELSLSHPSSSIHSASVQFSSVTQLCPKTCDPMDCSTPGLPVHHQLPEFTQTHVHWVSDAIQPSHLLLSPSPPALNLSQHQGLFKWVSSSPYVAKVLEFQLQHQSFQWTPRTDLL